ncbi:MAG TPA: amidohydrolase family protein [Pseudonocardiaceae bacterium]|jgi:imidazolonepropionase-like amidohydrolase|nr:amidohydrolase family protein [Pseudonocardiaceae bacterium]
MTTRLTNAQLIDGTGTPPIADATVCFDQDTISYAGPSAHAPQSPDDTIIDVRGGTVLPGFIDSHVHLGFAHGAGPGKRALEDPVHLVFDTAERLRMTLDAGITTARDLGGLPAGYRTAVATGKVTGPRLHTAVRIISHTGGHADVRQPDGTDLSGGMSEIADSVDEVRLAVRRVLRAGADVVKVCATGGMASPYDDPDDEGLLADELRAAVHEAQRHGGKPVAAHAQGTAGILNALRARVTSIEHGYGIDDAGLDLAGEHGSYLVPTLSTVYAGINRDTMPDYHYQKKTRWSGRTKENIARAIERGVRIAMGTDAAVGPHGQNLRELAYLVDLGMSPMDAILAGTRTAAELLGLSDQLGTVTEGKHADLVVCQGDPLAAIEVLGDPANIVTVIKQGKVLKNLD